MVQLSQDTGHLRAFWLIFFLKKKKPHPVVDLTTSQELAGRGGCGWRADACARSSSATALSGVPSTRS